MSNMRSNETVLMNNGQNSVANIKVHKKRLNTKIPDLVNEFLWIRHLKIFGIKIKRAVPLQ